MRTVAVVDIGSNSIKILVAGRDTEGKLVAVKSETLEARISAGISQATPQLSHDGMARGLTAIQTLLAAAAPLAPERVIMVATSAVRDARNGAEFTDLVRRETGCELRILTGKEEANAIGLGLTCDPALTDFQNFYVFDLGGGSLECLAFEDRRIVQTFSLQLGCVRLTEKFAPDPTAPLPVDCTNQIMTYVKSVLALSSFRFDLPLATAIATGGTAATVRAIHAARRGLSVEKSSSLITVRQLHDLLSQLVALPLEKRRQFPGLSPDRADVFHAALATLLAVAEAGKLTSFRHSFYNLRYGLAAAALDNL